MKAPQLQTINTNILLVEPDIERDAQLGQQWLEGELGRNTLKLMGVADKHNQATTLGQEKERVRDFIKNADQLNWMIQLDHKVVGSIWVDLKSKDKVPAPGLHIMIGDPIARSKGVGSASAMAVIDYLKQQAETAVYSRTLVNNTAAKKFLKSIGFVPEGEPYTDEDGLEWQNAALHL
jgi:RimJ/RimL family protein N-acetyltransferase